jgi:C4-dicarboxylate-specific signal transduction histidine kinase
MFVPVFSFLLAGKRWGLLYFFIHVTLLLAISIDGLSHWEAAPYSQNAIFRILLATISLGFFMYFYENSRFKGYSFLQSSLESEERHKEELAAANEELNTVIDELHNYREHLEQKVEEEIQKRQSNQALLAQQSKMAALGEMLASIGHQWKQPLAVISAINTQIAIKSSIDQLTDEKVQEFTQSTEDQVVFMTQTLADLSNFFKPDKVRERFYIHEAIKSILNLFENLYNSQDVHIHLDIKDPIEIDSYRNEFRQVILNIINNARDVIIEKNPKKRDIDFSIYQKERALKYSSKINFKSCSIVS